MWVVITIFFLITIKDVGGTLQIIVFHTKNKLCIYLVFDSLFT